MINLNKFVIKFNFLKYNDNKEINNPRRRASGYETLSTNQNSSIFSLVSYAWAGFGSTIGPLILLALFWKRTTRNGALVGLIVGAVTVIVWHSLSGGIFDVYEILPGFAFCLIAAVIVSLCGKPDEDTVRKFEAYQSLAD